MRVLLRISLIVIGAALAIAGFARQAAVPGSRARHMVFMQYSPANKLIEISGDGLLWEHPVPSLAVMFELLPNGHVMYAYGGNPTGVQEIDREHHVVWN